MVYRLYENIQRQGKKQRDRVAMEVSMAFLKPNSWEYQTSYCMATKMYKACLLCASLLLSITPFFPLHVSLSPSTQFYCYSRVPMHYVPKLIHIHARWLIYPHCLLCPLQTSMWSALVKVACFVYRGLQVGWGTRVWVGNHNLHIIEFLDYSAEWCCDQ